MSKILLSWILNLIFICFIEREKTQVLNHVMKLKVVIFISSNHKNIKILFYILGQTVFIFWLMSDQNNICNEIVFDQESCWCEKRFQEM